MKKLPIGIQNFTEIRNDDYVYIDKTRIASALIEGGKYYFLSRPRRFGKSLFLDTLKCIFEGKKELFEGLYIHDVWNLEKKYPVIKISFGGGIANNAKKLTEMIYLSLRDSETDNHVEAYDRSNYSNYFRSLIKACYEKYKMPVAILIDEYDKPILDNITDEKSALEMRNCLRDLYSAIKDSDEYIKFAFLTGVSKFSKMNLFSGLNNLKDITLDERYSTVCGYTHNDIRECFRDYLKDTDLEEMKRWYNGYSFIGESVYNPYDILLFFDRGRQFRSYWFETGTPTFLMDMVREKKYYLPDLENIEVSEEILNTFDVGNIPIESLMFQTGYLTIKYIKPSRIPHIKRYCLGFPNFEVKHAFLNYFIDYLAESYSTRSVNQDELYGILEDLKVEKLETVLRSLFSGIPYNAYVKNNIGDYEGFYLSVIYAYFYSLGVDIRLEEASGKGRADMVVKFPENTVYIFEFKVVEEDNKNSKKPLEQIKEKGYSEKYKGIFKKIFLIGIELSKKERNITGFEFEEMT